MTVETIYSCPPPMGNYWLAISVLYLGDIRLGKMAFSNTLSLQVYLFQMNIQASSPSYKITNVI